MVDTYTGAYKEGDPVEVALTDESWVDATVVRDMDRHIQVKLSVPVVWVKKVVTVKSSWFGFVQEVSESESSQLVETMKFAPDLIRLK